MCRSIKPLFNFDPPASEDEIRSAALQFVRKISGFHKPSKTNEAAFGKAVEEISSAAQRLVTSLETSASPKNRDSVMAEARARSAQRFPK